MARNHDPLHWARKAAQHPFGRLDHDPEHVQSNLFIYAVSKFGDALYEVNDPIPETRGFWCHEIKSGAWRPWTRFVKDGRGFLPLPPPLPIGMNFIQPDRRGPRWHVLTPDELYASQRLRIDPTWQPSRPNAE